MTLTDNSSVSIGKIIRKGLYAVLGLITIILAFMVVGINDAGYRTVVQWPNGHTFVKFDPGMYLQLFGSTWEYNDVLTLDFNPKEDAENATLSQQNISVRYQDGGLGHVTGITRFRLPTDEETMLLVHKEFRSNEGIAGKLLVNVTEEAMNQTAGLMSSEASYAEKRGVFGQWARDQIVNGKYKTRQEKTFEVEYGFEYCLEENLTEKLQEECRNVKKVTKYYPTILMRDGQPQYEVSDLKQYGITVTGFSIVDWGYEPKTLDQISTKREATMAIITAKANAERAKQDAITAEQQGLANVKVAEYEQEVEKIRQVVIAEREKEVAVIDAQKKVELAAQEKLRQEQNKEAMVQYKQAEILRGEGDAAYKAKVLAADGALAQKLETYERVSQMYAEAIAKQKWVPEVQMGDLSGGTGSNAEALINMLTVKTAKDLSLDMSIPK